MHEQVSQLVLSRPNSLIIQLSSWARTWQLFHCDDFTIRSWTSRLQSLIGWMVECIRGICIWFTSYAKNLISNGKTVRYKQCQLAIYLMRFILLHWTCLKKKHRKVIDPKKYIFTSALLHDNEDAVHLNLRRTYVFINIIVT